VSPLSYKAERLGHRAGTDHESVTSYGKAPEVFGLAYPCRAYSWDMRQTRQPSKQSFVEIAQNALPLDVGRIRINHTTGAISELEDKTRKRVLISQSLKLIKIEALSSFA
jgi:hypothetical protein